MNRNALPRVVDEEYEDPVTMNSVNPREAYYIASNATGAGGSRIRHVFHKSTLDQILGTSAQAPSPLTRKPFRRSDIKKAPLPGRLHPQLENKKVQVVFKHQDTMQHTFSRLRPGQRIDFITSEPEKISVTVTKLDKGSPGNRTYRMNVNMDMNFTNSSIRHALNSLADVVGQSTEIVNVTSSRVVRLQPKK